MIKSFLRWLMFNNRSNAGNTQQQASQHEATTQQNNAHEIEAINEQKRANRISIISNKLGRKANILIIWSLAINGVLFIATLIIFGYNIRAINAAVKSADVADSTLQMQRHQTIIDSIAERRNDSIDNIIRARMFAYSDSSFALNKQYAERTNNDRKEMIEEERKSNEERIKILKYQITPRLSAVNFSLDTLKVNQEMRLTYFIKVSGVNTIKILSYGQKIGVSSFDNQVRNFDFSTISFQESNIDIEGGATTAMNFYEPYGAKLTQQDYIALTNHNASIYFAGQYNYKSEITGDTFKYKFIFKIQISRDRENYIQISALVNENEAIK